MRFHIQPEEPNICKCGNTIASGLDWCDECDDEARESAQDSYERSQYIADFDETLDDYSEVYA